MIEVYKKKGGHILGEEEKEVENQSKKNKRKSEDSESDETNSDYDAEKVMTPKKKVKKIGGKDGFEVVSRETGKSMS